MATEYDGSIKIGTGIDMSGFKAGSAELRSAMQSLAQSVAGTAQQAQQATANMFAPGNNTQAMEQAQELGQAVEDTAARAREATENMIQPGDTTAATERVEELEQTVDQAAEHVQEATANMLQPPDNSELIDEVEEIDIAMERAQLKVEKAQQALREYAETEIPTEEYQALTADLEKTQAALNRMYERAQLMNELGTDKASAAYRRLAVEIEHAEEDIEYLEQKAKQLEAQDGAYISPETTLRFRELTLNVQEAQQALENLEYARQSESEAAAAEEEETSRAHRLAEGLKSVGASALTAAGKVAHMMKKFITDKVKAGLRGIVDHIKSIGRHSKASALSANALVKAMNGFKRMLVTRIKRTFISYIFNQITSAVKSLAQFDSEFDSAFSAMRNRTTELAANLVSAFGSIVKTVGPYVAKLIDLASEAAAKVAALLAQLRGETVVAVAKRQTQSYADSLNDSAKSADKANAAQKRLNASLSSYDQLHKLNGNEDDATTNTGDKAGDNLFTNADVEGLLKDVPDIGKEIIARIRASIARGDWKAAGAAVGDGINEIVQAARKGVAKLRPVAEEWAKNAGLFLSGIVEKIDGYQIGALIGDAINTVFSTLRNFVENFSWAELGRTFADGVNGLFETVSWEEIGQTLAAAVNGVLDFIGEAITKTDWKKIGEDLGTAISEFIGNVNWEKIGEDVEAFFGGALDFLTGAISKIDTGKLGEDLIKTLENVDWDSVFTKTTEFIDTAFSGLLDFLKGLVKEALNGLVEWWNTTAFDETGVFTMDGLTNGIQKAITRLNPTQWMTEHVGNKLVEGFKNALGIHSPSKVMEEQGEYLIAGLEKGLGSDWTSIQNAITAKAQQIKTALDAKWKEIEKNTANRFAEISDQMTQFMADASEGVADAVEQVQEETEERFKSLQENTARRWNDIKQAIVNKADDIKRLLPSKWTAIKQQAEQGFYDLQTAVTSKITDLWNALAKSDFSYIGTNLAAGITRGLNDAWSGAVDAAGSLFEGIVNKAKETFDIHSPSKVFEAIGAYLAEGLGEGIEDKESAVLRTVSDMAQSITDSMAIDAQEINISGVEGTEDSILGHLTAVADRLSGIAASFMAIDKALANMGGIQIPVMATGTVIPPSTRVGGDWRGSVESTADPDVKRLLTRIVELLQGKDDRGSGGTPITLEVISKLDRRELARAITEIEISNGRVSNGRSGRP